MCQTVNIFTRRREYFLQTYELVSTCMSMSVFREVTETVGSSPKSVTKQNFDMLTALRTLNL